MTNETLNRANAIRREITLCKDIIHEMAKPDVIVTVNGRGMWLLPGTKDVLLRQARERIAELEGEFEIL